MLTAGMTTRAVAREFNHFPTISRLHQCSTDLQWLAKIFTHLGIFPILLPYNLELK
jgi:hypothetical protein